MRAVQKLNLAPVVGLRVLRTPQIHGRSVVCLATFRGNPGSSQAQPVLPPGSGQTACGQQRALGPRLWMAGSWLRGRLGRRMPAVTWLGPGWAMAGPPPPPDALSYYRSCWGHDHTAVHLYPGRAQLGIL